MADATKVTRVTCMLHGRDGTRTTDHWLIRLTVDCAREPGLQKCCLFLRPLAKMDVLSEYEPPHDQTNKMAFAPSEDSDQPGHPPSLSRVFAVLSMGS